MLKRMGLVLAVAALLVPGYQQAASYDFENKTGKEIKVIATKSNLKTQTLVIKQNSNYFDPSSGAFSSKNNRTYGSGFFVKSAMFNPIEVKIGQSWRPLSPGDVTVSQRKGWWFGAPNVVTFSSNRPLE